MNDKEYIDFLKKSIIEYQKILKIYDELFEQKGFPPLPQTESPQGELPKIPGAKPREPEEVERILKPLVDFYENVHNLPQEKLDTRVMEIFEWLLGEKDDFPDRKEGEGVFYWRKELRKRLQHLK